VGADRLEDLDAPEGLAQLGIGLLQRRVGPGVLDGDRALVGDEAEDAQVEGRVRRPRQLVPQREEARDASAEEDGQDEAGPELVEVAQRVCAMRGELRALLEPLPREGHAPLSETAAEPG